MDIAENLKELRQDIQKYSSDPNKVKIVAATKYIDSIEKNVFGELIKNEIFDFGENRIQSLREKRENLLDMPIKWHFIGNLQKNKIKYIIDYIHMIHSIDSLSLAQEIEKRSAKIGRKISGLLEVNISGEKSKAGLTAEETKVISEEIINYSNLEIKGLMTMAPFTSDEKEIRNTFRGLADLKEELNKTVFNGTLTELSMGMTNDYKIALEEGATMIRIGSKIFYRKEVIKNE